MGFITVLDSLYFLNYQVQPKELEIIFRIMYPKPHQIV